MTLLIILYFGGLGWVGGPQHGQDVVSTFTLYFMKSDIYFRMRNEFEGGIRPTNYGAYENGYPVDDRFLIRPCFSFQLFVQVFFKEKITCISAWLQ